MPGPTEDTQANLAVGRSVSVTFREQSGRNVERLWTGLPRSGTRSSKKQGLSEDGRRPKKAATFLFVLRCGYSPTLRPYRTSGLLKGLAGGDRRLGALPGAAVGVPPVDRVPDLLLIVGAEAALKFRPALAVGSILRAWGVLTPALASTPLLVGAGGAACAPADPVGAVLKVFR